MGIDHFCSVMFYVRVCDRPKSGYDNADSGAMQSC
jgi:hypothetical protein